MSVCVQWNELQYSWDRIQGDFLFSYEKKLQTIFYVRIFLFVFRFFKVAINEHHRMDSKWKGKYLMKLHYSFIQFVCVLNDFFVGLFVIKRCWMWKRKCVVLDKFYFKKRTTADYLVLKDIDYICGKKGSSLNVFEFICVYVNALFVLVFLAAIFIFHL